MRERERERESEDPSKDALLSFWPHAGLYSLRT